MALTSYKALVWYGGATVTSPCVAGGRQCTVLVLGGAGGCGTTGIQLARHLYSRGVNIIATCGADDMSYCQALGANVTYDYRAKQQWWQLLANASIDTIYDTVGEAGTADRAMPLLSGAPCAMPPP